MSNSNYQNSNSRTISQTDSWLTTVLRPITLPEKYLICLILVLISISLGSIFRSTAQEAPQSLNRKETSTENVIFASDSGYPKPGDSTMEANNQAFVFDNHAAVPPNETFQGTWPFPAHYSSAPGFNMHYIDEGEGDEIFLLLHGEPTWGYLFRQQIAHWARHARVIAVDHMGFGKSETPSDRTYWLQDHVDNLEALVLDLELSNITLIMHDFGGPVGMGFAARHPDKLKRIVSINAPVPFGQPDLFERVTANANASPWFQWIAKAESDGNLDEVLGHLDYNILSTLKLNGFVNNTIISDTWIRAYQAPFPTPAYAAGAIGWAKGFATGMHQFAEPNSQIKMAITQLPAMAIWGEQDLTLQAEHFLPLFSQLFPEAPVYRLAHAGHYSPEDAAEDINQLVLEFVFDL